MVAVLISTCACGLDPEACPGHPLIALIPRLVQHTELAELAGALAKAQAETIIRITEPQPGGCITAEPVDRLLTLAEAAEIAKVQVRYFHGKKLPCLRRLGRRTVSASERGLLAWLATRR